jgi:hypothetical protein
MRTHVSSLGSGSNPCTTAARCATIQATDFANSGISFAPGASATLFVCDTLVGRERVRRR